MENKDKEKDEFWNIEKLVPPKKTVTRPFATGETLVPLVLDGKESSCAHLTLTTASSARSYTETSYVPKGNPFIRQITIRHYSDRYDFYDSFRKAAEVYYDVKTPPSEFVPFYSYMPQYSQMNKEQKNYYFFWRDELRHGRYIRSDYSYLYLFVYEILNLPERIPAKEGIKLLCEIWRIYRRDLPRIDRYFSVWVQDYCMVWQLPSPVAEIRDFIFDVIETTGFKEFYLSDIDTTCHEGVTALTACLSDYDWHAGRYATGESAKTYRGHMEGALSYLFGEVLREQLLKLDRTPCAKIVRDAFPNSLCTHSVKSRLEIEYYPLASAAELRAQITASVKYIENRLRAILGVKSRLAVKGLPDRHRAIVDRYFEDIFKKVNRERMRANIPEYEKQYDAPKEALSFERSDEIEACSWQTTLRLVDEETAEALIGDKTDKEAEICPPQKTAELMKEEKTQPIGELEGAFLRAILEGCYDEAKQLARESGELPDSLAERINEAFMDIYQDSLLEPDGDAYRVIDDYREDSEEWLRNMGM